MRAVAVQGGWGRNSGGRVLFRIGGVIVAGDTPNVLTTTSSLAELVSFTRALQWALHDIDARRKRRAWTSCRSSKASSLCGANDPKCQG